MRIDEVAPGLLRDPAGFWVAPEEVPTSYPIDGLEGCLPIEEESFWFAHRNHAILSAVWRYPPANGPIFDVGAGNGYVAAALERAGFPVIAIEPNRAGAVNVVARRVEHVVCGGLPSVAFREGTAGAIGLFDVLEHVENDCAFLRSVRPYARKGGRLYVTTPAFPWLWSDNDTRSGHHRRYTIHTLSEALRSAGFVVDYATYFFWCLPLPILFFRALRSNNSQARARRQHAAGNASLRRFAGALFAFETRVIRCGASIPFGGSCLIIGSVA